MSLHANNDENMQRWSIPRKLDIAEELVCNKTGKNLLKLFYTTAENQCGCTTDDFWWKKGAISSSGKMTLMALV